MRYFFKHEFERSGLSVSIGGQVIDKVNEAVSHVERANQVEDKRLAALHGYKAVDTIMKIIRTLAGLLLVVGVVFPVSYNIFILPPIEKQQHVLESMITELKLDEGNGIYFKEVNRTKLNFHYVYVYNKTMYNKLEIKNLLFQKLHNNGWKSRSTGASRSINYISEMEKNNYICEAHIYDEHFDIRLKYKELYE